MPGIQSFGASSSRVYGLSGRVTAQSPNTPKVSFNPSSVVDVYYVPQPSNPAINWEVLVIKGSGTLQLDPSLSITPGPTQFQMQVVVVGGGGGSGRPGFVVSGPPFFYPRLASAGGGGGGGGVSPVQTYYADSLSIPVSIGAGGGQNVPGQPSQFGPSTVTPQNPGSISATGGGAGGYIDSSNNWNGSPVSPLAGYYRGGSGGGAAYGINNRQFVPRPFGGGFYAFPMSPVTSTASGGYPGLEGGSGANGAQSFTAYYTPVNATPWAFFSGSGGGSAPTPMGGSAVAATYNPGGPIVKQQEGKGTAYNLTGPIIGYGGGGAGSFGTYWGSSYDPYYAPQINTMEKVIINGGGGSSWAGMPSSDGLANSGGGGGAWRQYFDYIPSSMPSFYYPYYGNGTNGGSGVVIVRYPAPSAR